MQLTPMFEQYQQIKSKYQESLLLFRVGDFYEFYYEDAKKASTFLGITLTSKTVQKGIKVPLAGVPVKAAETYIAKLVKMGMKIAICEQLEPATKGKKLVARDVVEVITPGTIMRPTLLDEKRSLILAACLPDEKKTGIAFCDITSGDFTCGEVDTDQIQEVILRREAREIVVPESVAIDIKVPLTNIDGYHFIQDIAYKKLLDHFRVVALDGFGIEGFDLGISAAGALLYYLEENQKTTLPHINRITLFNAQDALYLDCATRKNMELFENIGGGDERTLLHIMDACITLFGKRMLRRELLEPMTDPAKIQQRLDGVEELKNKDFLRQELREIFKKLRDVERITARLACLRIMPRELVVLKDSLSEYPMIKGLVQECQCEILRTIHDRITEFDDLVERINSALADDPPATMDEGGIIKQGYSDELDKLRDVAKSGKKWVLEFSATERRRTGITSLKVAYNSIFGYYIEITKPNLHLVPDSYIRKQTLANSERFYTPELKEFEEKILGAEEKISALEQELYTGLREEIAQHTSAILETTRALSMLDILQGFA